MKKQIQLISFLSICLLIFHGITFASEIINTDKPLNGEWEAGLQKIWKVGNAGENFFTEVKKIQVDERGNIFLFDIKLKKFFVITADGSFKFAFGRPGEGPGEYKRVENFFLIEDLVIIADERKVIYFTKEGKYLKDIRPQKLYEHLPRAFADKNRFIAIPPKSEEQNQHRDRIELYNLETNSHSTIAEIAEEENTVQINRSTTVTFAGGKYTPSIILCGKNDHLYYGKNDSYTITKLNLSTKNSLTFSLKGKERNKVPKAEIENFRSRLGKVLPKEQADKAIEAIPEYATWYFSIDVDDRGFVYVYPTIPGAPSWQRAVDIFSPSGKYIFHSKLTFPKGYTIKSNLEIKGDHLYVFLEDPDGEGALFKYTISRPEFKT